MHWENLRPLLPLAPLVGLLLVVALGWLQMERIHRVRLDRRTAAEMRRYWISEMAYRARMRTREWLDRSRIRRLTYQPQSDVPAIAATHNGDYAGAMENDFATRLARAKFRAWHRGTREADYTIGGFFDRYHASWSEAELAWFEALLEEDDVDILAWAMKSREAPEKYHGTLLEDLQKLDFVTI